MLEGLDLWG